VTCSNQTSKKNTTNDWKENGLKGKVKSAKMFKYDNIDSLGRINPNCEKKLCLNKLFNKEGKVILIEFHIKHDFEEKYKYDNNGNLIEKIGTNQTSDTFQYQFTYKYDNNGRKIEGSLYLAKGINAYNYKYKYDKKNNLVEELRYDTKGILSGKECYKYDENSNKIESDKYGSDTILINKCTAKYDSVGNKIEYYDYSPNDSTSHKDNYKYDSNKNIIERKRLKLNSNPNNAPIVEVYKYEFDKIGNWVKQITYINNKPKFIQVREIEYY
jgi:hypothetical protein